MVDQQEQPPTNINPDSTDRLMQQPTRQTSAPADTRIDNTDAAHHGALAGKTLRKLSIDYRRDAARAAAAGNEVLADENLRLAEGATATAERDEAEAARLYQENLISPDNPRVVNLIKIAESRFARATQGVQRPHGVTDKALKFLSDRNTPAAEGAVLALLRARHPTHIDDRGAEDVLYNCAVRYKGSLERALNGYPVEHRIKPAMTETAQREPEYRTSWVTDRIGYATGWMARQAIDQSRTVEALEDIAILLDVDLAHVVAEQADLLAAGRGLNASGLDTAFANADLRWDQTAGYVPVARQQAAGNQ